MSRVYELLSKTTTEQESLSRSLQPPADAQPFLDLPELLIDGSPESCEEFKCLYRNILLLSGKPIKILMVCSTQKGEGTTTVAMNLACLVAREENKPTLLVEANFNTPMLFQYKKGSAKEGFCELLLDQGDLDNYLVGTSTPQLSAMCIGGNSASDHGIPNPSRIESALRELKRQFEFVVLDAAPLKLSKCSLQLASQVDGVVLVVKPGSPVRDVQNAKDVLERAQAKILGVVLNQKSNGNKASFLGA